MGMIIECLPHRFVICKAVHSTTRWAIVYSDPGIGRHSLSTPGPPSPHHKNKASAPIGQVPSCSASVGTPGARIWNYLPIVSSRLPSLFNPQNMIILSTPSPYLFCLHLSLSLRQSLTHQYASFLTLVQLPLIKRLPLSYYHFSTLHPHLTLLHVRPECVWLPASLTVVLGCPTPYGSHQPHLSCNLHLNS